MIKVNENTCIGCGACIAIAPENFDFNDNGLSQVISQEIIENTHEAANACPVNAITITEENNTKYNIIEFNNNDTEENDTETTKNNAA